MSVGVPPATFFRKKEERLFLVRVVDARNESRPADGAAKVVVPRWRPDNATPIIEEGIRVQHVVSEELVKIAVECARPRTRDYIDLPARTPPEFRILLPADYTELFNRIDARTRKER